MKQLEPGQLSEILALTQAGRIADATALIQRNLAGTNSVPGTQSGDVASAWTDAFAKLLPGQTDDAGKSGDAPKARKSAAKPAAARGANAPSKGNFTVHRYQGDGGQLGYWLYTPTTAKPGQPLVVMLHGCTQSPEDFARGTQMNALAEEQGFLVAYPEQTRSANSQKCWNWFRPGDQARDKGEPALIAGMTREIITEHRADASRVYVAGLSAGGAAASIMASVYPETFAAVGVHSGLACGSARDLPSALAAMKGQGLALPAPDGEYVPTITFHGEMDQTVHPSNSRSIHEARATDPKIAALVREATDAVSAGGRRYRQVKLTDQSGLSWAEHWHVAGSGHAWSGGSSQGSYTDPAGPDASREMMRFFLQHKRPAA